MSLGGRGWEMEWSWRKRLFRAGWQDRWLEEKDKGATTRWLPMKEQLHIDYPHEGKYCPEEQKNRNSWCGWHQEDYLLWKWDSLLFVLLGFTTFSSFMSLSPRGAWVYLSRFISYHRPSFLYALSHTMPQTEIFDMVSSKRETIHSFFSLTEVLLSPKMATTSPGTHRPLSLAEPFCVGFYNNTPLCYVLPPLCTNRLHWWCYIYLCKNVINSSLPYQAISTLKAGNMFEGSHSIKRRQVNKR